MVVCLKTILLACWKIPHAKTLVSVPSAYLVASLQWGIQAPHHDTGSHLITGEAFQTNLPCVAFCSQRTFSHRSGAQPRNRRGREISRVCIDGNTAKRENIVVGMQFIGLDQLGRSIILSSRKWSRYSSTLKTLSSITPVTVHAKVDDRDTPSTGCQVPTEQLSWLKRLLMTTRDGLIQKRGGKPTTIIIGKDSRPQVFSSIQAIWACSAYPQRTLCLPGITWWATWNMNSRATWILSQ
jgi:hypothetical protein